MTRMERILFIVGAVLLSAASVLWPALVRAQGGTLTPADINEILALAKAVGGDLDKVGLVTWAGLSAGVTGAMRLWTLPPTQRLLGGFASRVPALSWLYWGNMKPWVKWVLPVVVAIVATVATGLAQGIGWSAILIGAVSAGVGSIGTHHASTWAGSKIPDHPNKHINAGIRAVLPLSIRQAPLISPKP